MNIENLHGKKRYHEFNLIRANKLMQDGARAIGIGKGKIDGSTYVCFAVDEALLFLLQSYSTVSDNGFYQGSNKVKMNMVRTEGYNPSHYVIYISILSYRNTVTNNCSPTNEDIVKSSGTSIATVKRSLRWLKDNGFILVNSGTCGRASSYYFPKEDFYNNEGSKVVTRKVIKSEPKEEDIDKIF